MFEIATFADIRALEAEMPVTERWGAATLYEQLCKTSERVPDRLAVTFQLRSGPRDRTLTLSWAQLRAEVTRAANALRRLGVGSEDSVAYILPNGIEAVVALLAGATVGVVTPINPLLPPEHIAALLRESRVKLVITLAPFPKADVSERVARAISGAPDVETVLEVDLRGYLAPPLAWVIPLLRPRRKARHQARILDWRSELDTSDATSLDFDDLREDRVRAHFHSGGTTGAPKVTRHRASGMLYNGWCGASLMFTENDVLLCPLPMFHVLAAYPVFMSCLMSGAQMVMVTPQGYRGKGVFDNFWKLIARHRVTFMITVPTAVAALMHRPVDADVSTLRLAISGSAAMPAELFRRFEAATGVRVLEGYGLTEATCLVSINPPHGERRIGSVGLPFPYTDIRILARDAEGSADRDAPPGEVGEICVRNPGTSPDTYADANRNLGLFTDDGFLRTGDLGRIDADGYLWITGRAKDLIIRGGHNIDPAVVEEAMLKHPAVSIAGAVGQPDAHSGEVVVVYVELAPGAEATPEALLAHARSHVGERAAVPRRVEVLGELPRTDVGKVFKPDLRRRAIKHVYDQALAAAGLAVTVNAVIDSKQHGLVAILEPQASPPSSSRIDAVLGNFVTPWQWQQPPDPDAGSVDADNPSAV
jgi:fatty-acyl-CoA synthase